MAAKQSMKSMIGRLPLARTARNGVRRLGAYGAFARDFLRFRELAQSSRGRFELAWSGRLPCLADRTSTTEFDRHYVYHLAWATRILAQNRPKLHVDVSSYIYFPTMLSAFVPVHFYDYRPANVQLDNLESRAGDLMKLPFADATVESLSCMHVVEHVGLGRYGDPLDPAGDLKAMAELNRVVSPGGTLLFVVPIGKPVIRFNAHRIYAFRQIREAFAELDLREFALIPADAARGGLIRGATEAMADAEDYGCGCFWFEKPR